MGSRLRGRTVRANLLVFILCFSICVSISANPNANLEKLIDAGYLPAMADGDLAENEPVDRKTFANAIAKLLAEIQANTPEAKEELLRNLTVQLQGEVAKMVSQAKQFQESLERLEGASAIAQDELVAITAQSQKLAAEITETYQKLEELEQNIAAIDSSYGAFQASLKELELNSQNLAGEIEASRAEFQKELAANQSQLELVQEQISQAMKITEATFQRQGELLSELEERADALRRQAQELEGFIRAVEERSKQIGGQLETTEAALYQNVNQLQLDLASISSTLRSTEKKIQEQEEETKLQLKRLEEDLKIFQAKIESQQNQLAMQRAQNEKMNKLALAFGAVAVPLLLLLVY